MTTEDILKIKIKDCEGSIAYFESNIQKKALELAELVSKKKVEIELKKEYERDLEILSNSRIKGIPQERR